MRTDIVDAGTFPAVAQQYDVYAVPKTVINGTQEILGAQPEAEVVRALVATTTPGLIP